MPANNPILTVFKRYSFTVEKIDKPSPFNQEDGPEIDFTDFLISCLHNLANDRYAFTKIFSLSDRISFLFFNRFVCKIDNVETFLNNFNVSSSSVPIPIRYLKCYLFYFSYCPGENSSLLTSISNLSDLNYQTGITKETIRKDFYPEYAIKSIFDKQTATEEADEIIDNYAYTLDIAYDKKSVEAFKNDLLDSILLFLDITIDDLSSKEKVESVLRKFMNHKS